MEIQIASIISVALVISVLIMFRVP